MLKSAKETAMRPPARARNPNRVGERADQVDHERQSKDQKQLPVHLHVSPVRFRPSQNRIVGNVTWIRPVRSSAKKVAATTATSYQKCLKIDSRMLQSFRRVTHPS